MAWCALIASIWLLLVGTAMSNVIFVRFSNLEREDLRVRVKREAKSTTVKDVLRSLPDLMLEEVIKIEAYEHPVSAFKIVDAEATLAEVFEGMQQRQKQLLLTLKSTADECSAGAIGGKAFDLTDGNKMPLFGSELIFNSVHGDVNRDASSDGKTGLSTWDASIVLAQYLAINADKTVAGKTVIELGAGTGCVGITTAFLSPPPSRVIVSDLYYTLENLFGNVESNRFNPDLNMLIVPEVRELDWLKPETYLLAEIEEQQTVVLAADVAWLLPLVPPLVQAISSHLQGDAVMYLAHQTRSASVDDALFSGMVNQGLEVAEVPFDDLHPKFRSPRIRVFKIIARRAAKEVV